MSLWGRVFASFYDRALRRTFHVRQSLHQYSLLIVLIYDLGLMAHRGPSMVP